MYTMSALTKSNVERVTGVTIEEMKNMTVLDQKLSIKSTLKADQEDNLDAFAQQIIDAM